MGLPVIASLPDLGLNESKEMGLPDLGGLPELPALSGLPGLPGLPDIPDLPNLLDHFDDLEECIGNLLTSMSCTDDEALASGGVPNLGTEVNRNDIPELDLANVPGAVPPPPPLRCGSKKERSEENTERSEEEIKKGQKTTKERSRQT